MTERNTIHIDRDELVSATSKIMEYCQSEGLSELLAYMAMTTITKTMEDKLGFRCEPCQSVKDKIEKETK